MAALTAERFGEMFRDFTATAFRLETLDAYDVPEEAEAYRCFLRGEPTPGEIGGAWRRIVSEAIAARKRMSRIHVVSVPLSAYLRFEIRCGYVMNETAGEDIFLIDRETARSTGLDNLRDFWLFDDSTLVEMHYGAAGDFQRGELVETAERIAAARQIGDRLLALASPLRAYIVNEPTDAAPG